MPRIENQPVSKKRKRASKQSKPSTPIRNSLLLVIFAAILVAVVLLVSGDTFQRSASMVGEGEGQQAVGVPDASVTIRISELMASNSVAYPDEKGNYGDWVELVNEGDAAQSLEGLGLSDRDDRVTFIFPDITLEPGERIVVFCDDTSKADADGTLHARFKLSSVGETVYLFDSQALVIDQVEFPTLLSDTSYAKSGGEWVITDHPTPHYPNTDAGYEAMRSSAVQTGSALVISELCASNRTTAADEDGEYSDWIEIYNGGSLAIDLSNYALSDDEASPVKWRFPQGSVIQPGGYYLVFASGKDRTQADGTPHASFKLAAEGETVLLCDVYGQILDRTTYDNLDKDTSWGRVDGMEDTWQQFMQPTPGMANTHESEVRMDEAMRARNTSGLYISEVVTSNTGTETPYGVTSYDWIEIVNLGTQAVNLKGYGLSDNVGHPRKWQFGEVTLQPGEYLLVFPSGLTESPTGSGAIHADFRLSAVGETVVLSDPQGNILDKLVVPQLETDYSYGRNLDQGGLFYYRQPTAASGNGSGFTGYAAQPSMSVAGGQYTGSVTVELMAPDGVTIRYTTDGSDPTESVGEVYTGPITLSSVTVLRARGFYPGLEPSRIETNTYLINVYHTLPVISLVTDPDNLWNEETGIYAEGNNELYDKIPFNDTTYRVVKNDETLREREANFEYITEDGVEQLNQGVDIMLNGQFSLDMPQKSFRITARARYGEDTLAYAFFEDRPYTEYQALVLRNGGNDGSYTRLVDLLQSRIVDWTGADIIHMAGDPVIVYLNGQYWGQYHLRERINKYSIAAYEGWNDPDNIDFIKGEKDVLNGSFTNYKSLLNYVAEHDLNDPEALQTVLDWVDVENYFDFMIFQMYFGNTDTGNIKFYRQRTEGAKWRWVLFDLDWGYFNSSVDGCFVWLDPEGSGTFDYDNSIIVSLLEVPEMRDQFLKRYGELFQNYFSKTETIMEMALEIFNEIEPEMNLHFIRWAGYTHKLVASDLPSTPDAAYNYWVQRVNTRLMNTLKKRPNLAWQHVKDWFELSDEEMIGYFGPQPEMPEGVT